MSNGPYISMTPVGVTADVWNGTTQITTGVRHYVNNALTDSNGQITFNLTTTGLVGGTALFSQILSVHVIGLDGSGNPLQAPFFVVDSMSTTQVRIRGIRGTTTGVLIGGNILSNQFAGSGYTAYITIMGLK